jgi:hypothetical protein
MRRFSAISALAIVIGLSACGQAQKPAERSQAATSATPTGEAASDADAIARTTISAMQLPDPEGTVAVALSDALRALPPWAPLYPGARLGVDSATNGLGSVQISFTTKEPEDKVAAFYLQRFAQRGAPTDLKEAGVRTIEVASADDAQITSVILSPEDDGGLSVILQHEGGGY